MTYGRIQGKIFLPLLLALLAELLEAIWLPTTPLRSLTALIVSVPIWIWFYLRVWRYQPVPEENPARIRTVQIAFTLLSLFMITLFTFSWFAVVVFNGVVPFALDALVIVISILSLLGSCLMIWRDSRLQREEESESAEHS